MRLIAVGRNIDALSRAIALLERLEDETHSRPVPRGEPGELHAPIAPQLGERGINPGQAFGVSTATPVHADGAAGSTRHAPAGPTSR